MKRSHVSQKIRTIFAAAIFAMCIIFAAGDSALAKGMDCGKLATLKFPDTTITSAKVVPADGKLPEYCKVAATLTPRPDSEIKLEVWLPTSQWNGYYHTAANGGWAGQIDTRGQTAAVKLGFATASTDTGHTGDAGEWCFNKDKLLDFGGRAIHETTVFAKKITQLFYGKAPKASFMSGCSLGGQQTMKAIMDYPDDFDGVVAGSPHMFMTAYNAAQVWPAWLIVPPNGDPDKFIPLDDYKWIHEAVLEKCDGTVDGLKDGIVDDPLKCDFDPFSLVCKEGQTSRCLTKKQAEYLKQIYAGPVYQDTGESIYPGPLPGNELYWTTFTQPNPRRFFFDMFKWLYFGLRFGDPSKDFNAMTYKDDIRWVQNNVAPIIDADNPDLRPYFNHGGKLMMYIGTEEYENYSAHVVFLNKVRDIVGTEAFEKFVRLFVVPGMHHCGGGDNACDTFPKLETIVHWYETGSAPDVLDAAHVDRKTGETSFNRPLCAYPETARYKGSGDPSKAENFVCRQ